MADTVYRYEIDGVLVDQNGNKAPIDGSFEVDYTTGTISTNTASNVDIPGFNIGSLSSSIAKDGTTEYTASFQFFPEPQYLINYASITYDTMFPGYADSVSETEGSTQNPLGLAAGTDTYSGSIVPLVASAVSVCFTTGTLIRTAGGDVAVEDLCVGDMVVTASGPARPIAWIGSRRVACGRHPHPSNVMPVRIAAHAFGDGRPARDLLVSPGHAICVDVLGEVLIPAGALVNGTTIRREHVAHVTYWHVELDSHDVILAENLPCESYLEMGNRSFFAEAGATALHASPDSRGVTHAEFCRPFHQVGSMVTFVRERLAARLPRLGWTLQHVPLANLHLLVDGRRVEADISGLSARFLVPADAGEVWLVSETSVPAEVGVNTDLRSLGVCVGALVIDDGVAAPRTIGAEHPLLCVGFHHPEDGPQRWTAGRARLPAVLWDGCHGDVFLRVDLTLPALPRWIAPSVSVRGTATVSMVA